ncbi:Protein of unknown function [Gryllus bimaculatus]|nr:Protein of unknown function [Gryllus bimaculatus]
MKCWMLKSIMFHGLLLIIAYSSQLKMYGFRQRDTSLRMFLQDLASMNGKGF